MERSPEAQKREIRIREESASVAYAGAELFLKVATDSIKRAGIFSVALSGGNTPRALYSLLADPNHRFRESIPWENVHFFWGDERHLPPDHPDSNYRMVRDSLLSKVHISLKNIHPIPTVDHSPEEAAQAYENHLREFFRLDRGETPSLDLVLLGMGGDGHTASLFPGSILLKERRRLVMADPTPRLGHMRISVTAPLLNKASIALFLVSGEGKAEILNRVINGEGGKYPAQIVSPSRGRLIWLMDRGAGKFLTDKSSRKFQK